MAKKKLIILGATGSIGDSTLKILRAFPDLFDLVGISYHKNYTKATDICREFNVKHIYCSDPSTPVDITGTRHAENYQELLDADYDIVIVAIVGSAGVLPTYYAARQGKKILLANKESLVMAGNIIMEAVRTSGSVLLPVDSEHNSIFRLMNGNPEYQNITITASGGSLRDHTLSDLSTATIKDVLNHPTWSMGAKITVDSATMVNKALEIIEARHLFDMNIDDIGAVIHPESYIHAILKHSDGSLFFHVYKPDMIYSIAYCLFFPSAPPEIIPSGAETLLPSMTFREIDPDRYPAFFSGIDSGRRGGIYPAVFNAANEESVRLFLDGSIKYSLIPEYIDETLDKCPENDFSTDLEGLFAADQWARTFANNLLKQRR